MLITETRPLGGVTSKTSETIHNHRSFCTKVAFENAFLEHIFFRIMWAHLEQQAHLQR
jgi:hypothetical protein